jgi:hypothetical protein
MKRWGYTSLTAEIAGLAEKIRGILSVLPAPVFWGCGLSGEMVKIAHEHSHSQALGSAENMQRYNRFLVTGFPHAPELARSGQVSLRENLVVCKY